LSDAEVNHIRFQHAVIATGSHPVDFPGLEKHTTQRIMTSTEALELKDIPQKLLVIGGGYIGLELGTVYAALGSEVTMVEVGDRLLSGVDTDLVRVIGKHLQTDLAAIKLNTRVMSLEENETEVVAVLKDDDGQSEHRYDRVLVAIGRAPATAGLELEKAGVEIDGKGFIQVDEQMRTKTPAIFAIGDVTKGAMLAHRAAYQGKIVAEIINEMPSAFDVRALPAVVFSDPQIAWAGTTEEEAQRDGLEVEIRRLPWKVSGRAHIVGSPDGLTKMIVERSTRRIIGVGIVGRHAEDLISEAVVAIEMGALADDIALSMHPHPTLSETESEVADIFLGSATHMLSKKNGN
jgi:dihydrolipoamide dehydrogenase